MDFVIFVGELCFRLILRCMGSRNSGLLDRGLGRFGLRVGLLDILCDVGLEFVLIL